MCKIEMSAKDTRRFWAKVRKGGSPCWSWKGRVARFEIKGKPYSPARIMLFLNGKESSLQPRRTCKNQGCINPNHLQFGTVTPGTPADARYPQMKQSDVYSKPKGKHKRVPNLSTKYRELLWTRIEKTVGGCWNWLGSKQQIMVCGQLYSVTRVMMSLNGNHTDQRIRRSCGNEKCVNPDHLIMCVDGVKVQHVNIRERNERLAAQRLKNQQVDEYIRQIHEKVNKEKEAKMLADYEKFMQHMKELKECKDAWEQKLFDQRQACQRENPHLIIPDDMLSQQRNRFYEVVEDPDKKGHMVWIPEKFEFYINGTVYEPDRFALALVGQQDHQLDVYRLCKRRHCVNPNHLSLGWVDMGGI
jgi:hypothetical protein